MNHERNKVTLIVKGATLEPGRVTSLLGCAPTRSWEAGDTYRTPAGHELVRPWGQWLLERTGGAPADLCREVLTAVSDDVAPLLDELEHTAGEVSLGIWWEPSRAPSRFSLGPWIFRRIAAMAGSLHVYYPGDLAWVRGRADSLESDEARVILLGVPQAGPQAAAARASIVASGLEFASLTGRQNIERVASADSVQWLMDVRAQTMEDAWDEVLSRAGVVAEACKQRLALAVLVSWSPADGQGGFSMDPSLVVQLAAWNPVVHVEFAR